MGYVPLEDLLPKSGFSIYKLVRMASNRAIELADGQPRLVDVPSQMKTSTVAFEEIRAGKVVVTEVADQFAPSGKNARPAGKPLASEEPATE